VSGGGVMHTLSKRFRFDAAHFLPMVPEGHKCRRLHGHGFEVEIFVRGDLDPQLGWVIDYGELGRAVHSVLDPLDHTLLNAIPGLENPTSELLAVWIWDRLQLLLPGLSRVAIHETPRSHCEYEGPVGGGISG
jgi:6-pyruvoyltetrahydropterin/6-carboxytetrahydropterin synthase